MLGESKGGKRIGCRVTYAAKNVSLADVQCENTGVAAAMQALRLYTQRIATTLRIIFHCHGNLLARPAWMTMQCPLLAMLGAGSEAAVAMLPHWGTISGLKTEKQYNII